MMFIDLLDGCCSGDRNTWNTFPVSLNQTREKGSLLEKYFTANKKEPLTLSRGMVKKGVADDDEYDDE